MDLHLVHRVCLICLETFSHVDFETGTLKGAVLGFLMLLLIGPMRTRFLILLHRVTIQTSIQVELCYRIFQQANPVLNDLAWPGAQHLFTSKFIHLMIFQ